MGTHCSSEHHRGHIQVKKTTTMKLLLLTALAAVAMAEPEADAHYGYYGYGYHPGFYGYYGHQQAWPSVSAPESPALVSVAEERGQLKLMPNPDSWLLRLSLWLLWPPSCLLWPSLRSWCRWSSRCCYI